MIEEYMIWFFGPSICKILTGVFIVSFTVFLSAYVADFFFKDADKK